MLLSNNGELPSLKIGRRRLIRPESLRSWIETKEHDTQVAMGFDSQKQRKASHEV